MYTGLWTGLILLVPLAILFAVAGRKPFAREGARSFWVLSDDRPLPPRPFFLSLAGGLMGIVMDFLGMADDMAWTAAGAGFVVGLLRPLFRYRLGAFGVLSTTIGGGFFLHGWDDTGGTGSSIFMGAVFGFIYASLLWGDERDEITDPSL